MGRASRGSSLNQRSRTRGWPGDVDGRSARVTVRERRDRVAKDHRGGLVANASARMIRAASPIEQTTTIALNANQMATAGLGAAPRARLNEPNPSAPIADRIQKLRRGLTGMAPAERGRQSRRVTAVTSQDVAWPGLSP